MIDLKTMLQRYQPRAVASLGQPRQLCTARFSPCGKVLAAGGFDGGVHRFDSSTDAFAAMTSLTGHNGWVTTLAFHPDGKRLFSADSWGRLRAWPYAEKTPKPLWDLPQAHDGWIRQLALSADGKLLATCGLDGGVRLWSDDGKKVAELSDIKDEVYSLVFHPDGASLLCGSLKGSVRQWNLAAGKWERSFDCREMYLYDRIQDVGGVRCLSFDRAGATLACAGAQPKGGGFVQAVPLLLFFDWTTGKLLHTIKGSADTEGYILDLSWHSDGFVMAVTSGQPGNGKLFFQRPGDAQPFFVAAKPNCHALAVHPNGRRLVVAATNANSAGNGRVLDKNKEYVGNTSPLFVWDLPKVGS
jgi:hypothetical protein